MIEYLAQHLWQMWAVVAVICLILELTAGDFFISAETFLQPDPCGGGGGKSV